MAKPDPYKTINKITTSDGLMALGVDLHSHMQTHTGKHPSKFNS
jgi:hypothetical protein